MVSLRFRFLTRRGQLYLLYSIAEKFDPDRFLDERLHKYLTPRPFIFLPFNAGPRICLGQQFAYNETSFFLVRLLQKYNNVTLDVDAQPEDSRPPPNWRTEPGEPDERKRFEMVRPKSHLTLYCYVRSLFCVSPILNLTLTYF